MQIRILSLVISMMLPIYAAAGNGSISTAILINLDRVKYEGVSVNLDDDFLYNKHCSNSAVLGRAFIGSDGVDSTITNDLVYKAFINEDDLALTKLGRKLVKYKEYQDYDSLSEKEPPFGLDGIIVYSSKPKPRFMSLTTPRNYKHKVKIFYIENIYAIASIQDAFCKAIPHYTGIPK